MLGQNLGRHWRSMKREEEEDSAHRTRETEMDTSDDPRSKADGELMI